jgi:monofunctional biosynthetic peptidoglycan transglycosylase
LRDAGRVGAEEHLRASAELERILAGPRPSDDRDEPPEDEATEPTSAKAAAESATPASTPTAAATTAPTAATADP